MGKAIVDKKLILSFLLVLLMPIGSRAATVNFDQFVDETNGRIAVRLSSAELSGQSVSMTLNFSYNGTDVGFDDISFPSSYSSSIFSSQIGSSGTVQVTSSIASAVSGDLATIYFYASGAGTFSMNVSTLRLNGQTATYTSPPPINYVMPLPPVTESKKVTQGVAISSAFVPFGEQGQLSIVKTASHGTLALIGAGEWTYTSVSDYSGSDTFTLRSTNSGTGQSQDLIVSMDVMPDKYGVYVTKIGEGTVSSSPAGIICGDICEHDFKSASEITLTAIPDEGFRFKSWSGACSGSDSQCVVVLNGNTTVSATFEEIKHELTIGILGQGSVTSEPAGINCPTACNSSFKTGTTVTLIQLPVEGYAFTGWGEACSGTGACTVTMDEDKTVSATFTPKRVLSITKSGDGTITSVPARISCGSTCSGEFGDGTTVSLIAQPDYGFAFAGWTGACAGTGTCIVTMSGSQSVSANFIELPKYPVKISRPSTGLISSEPAGILCGGPNRQCSSMFSSAKLTATANPGYEFARWTGCQAPEGSICYIKPSGKMTVKPVFKKLPKYNVKISKNNLGSITSVPGGLNCPDKKKSCSVKFIKGTQVTLTAVPQAGRTFGGWTGVCSGIEPCTLSIDGSKGVGAIFQ